MTKRPLSYALYFLAVGAPVLIGVVILPIPTFLNELTAILGWAGLVIFAGRRLSTQPASASLLLAIGSALVLSLGVLGQTVSGWVMNPTLSLSWLFFIGCGVLCCVTGYLLSGSGYLELCIDELSWILLGSGALCISAELIQYFQIPVHPYVVSPLHEAGRIYANIRQPNHLASFLLTCLVGTGWLVYRKKIPEYLGVIAIYGLMSGTVLTGSRTGLASLLMLISIAIWLTYRGSRRLSIWVWLSPLYVFGLLGLLVALADLGSYPFYSAERTRMMLIDPASNTGTRLELWTNSLLLIRQNWLFGTGFGQFQFYYLLTDLPIEFPVPFTNAHSLPLQLAAEFGVPLTVLILGLALTAAYRSVNALKDPAGLIAGLFMLPVIVHSLFEFPLWYAYFLLPTAAAFGLFIGRSHVLSKIEAPGREAKIGNFDRRMIRPKLMVIGGTLITAMSLVALTHYLTLAAIYRPGGAGDTLEERQQSAKNAFIYAHWINNSLLTSRLLENITDDQARQLVPLFDKAARFHMDELFLYRYTLALMQADEIDRALRVANALGLRHSPFIFKLKSYCDARPEGKFKILSKFLDNPTKLRLSAKDFPG